MKKKQKTKHNGFQGNQLLLDTVADALGYKDREFPEYSWFTKDIYLSTFFYLCKRFGQPKVFDDYKEAGLWDFDVKGYTVRIELDCSYVNFIIYGEKFPMHPISPYQVKKRRAIKKNRDKYVDFLSKKKTKKEGEILKSLFKVFSAENGLDKDEYTVEMWHKDTKMQSKWWSYVEANNNKMLEIGTWKEHEEEYGEHHLNSCKRHALRTLSQFVKNMLTPIWIRDVAYNIKGELTDKEAWGYDCRYTDNVKINFKKPKLK